MTHAPEVLAEALRLISLQSATAEIASRLDIPRRTVADWRLGRVPQNLQGASRPVADEELPVSYPYLLGMYLGDGCISAHARGVYRLRVTLDAIYPRIIDECSRAIADIVPGNRVGRLERSGDVVVSAYSKRWAALFPQHGLGLKHRRPIVLEDWQWQRVERAPELLLRGLIQSDGCRFINTGRNWSNPRYSFSNRSADIRQIFCDACDLFGVHWTTAPHTVYVSRKADVARFDEVIGPKA